MSANELCHEPGQVPSTDDVPEAKVRAAIELLRGAVQQHGKVVYSTVSAPESMVLTDLIYTHVPQIGIFTIDTGRLHEETYALLERIERRYQRRIRIYYPDPAALEAYTAENGINGFYNGLAERQSCCHVRKVEPFRRAIRDAGAWVTGVRHEQSATRAQVRPVEFDPTNGIHKISLILDWSNDEVWAYPGAQAALQPAA
jgi:phosphoadenosine phosphosulfate reductase